MKTLKNILITLAILAVGLPLLAGLGLQFPQVQTAVTRKVTEALGAKLGACVEVGRVYLVFFNKVLLTDIVLVEERAQQQGTEDLARPDGSASLKKTEAPEAKQAPEAKADTLLHIGKLYVDLKPLPLLHKELRLHKVLVSGGRFQYIVENKSNFFKRLSAKSAADSSATAAKGPSDNPEKKLSANEILAKDSLAAAAPDSTQTGKPWQFSLARLEVKDFGFRLINRDKAPRHHNPECMEFSNLHVYDIRLDARDLYADERGIHARLRSLSAKEQSGFVLQHLGGELLVNEAFARLRDMDLSDLHSHITAPFFQMTYGTSRNFKHYVHDVGMAALFRGAYFDFKTLNYFAPKLRPIDFGLHLDGGVSGTVTGLNSRGIRFRSKDGGTYLDARFRINGLPKVAMTTAFVDVDSLATNLGELHTIVQAFSGAGLEKQVANLGADARLRFKGRLAGLLSDFVADGRLRTDFGELDIDALVNDYSSEEGLELKGYIQARDIEAGKLANLPRMGRLNFYTEATALLRPAAAGGPAFSIDSFHIQGLDWNGHRYQNLFARGAYDNREFTARFRAADSLLRLTLDGRGAFVQARAGRAGQDLSYNLSVDIDQVDLCRTGLLTTDSTALISGSLIAHIIQGQGGKDLTGTLSLSHLAYQNSRGTHRLQELQAFLSHSPGASFADIQSPALDLQFEGSHHPLQFYTDLQAAVLYNHFPQWVAPPAGAAKGSHYQVELNLKDFSFFEQFLPSRLDLSSGTRLSASLDAAQELRLDLRSPRLGLSGQGADSLLLALRGNPQALRLDLDAAALRAAGLTLPYPHVEAEVAQLALQFTAHYMDSLALNTLGRIEAWVEAPDKDHINVQLGNSFFTLDQNTWYLQPAGLSKAGDRYGIEGFKIFNQNRYFTLDGAISPDGADSLDFRLANFDLSILDVLTAPKGLQLGGTLTGQGRIQNAFDNLLCVADIRGRGLRVNQDTLGLLHLDSHWNTQEGRLDLALNCRPDSTASPLLDLRGHFKPKTKEVDMNLLCRSFPLGLAQPFLTGVVSHLHGGLSTQARLYGKLPDLNLVSTQASLDGVGFTVDYTQVPYTLHGPVAFTPEGLALQNLTVQDQLGHNGMAQGMVKYKHFRDISLDVLINFLNMQLIATTAADNEIFYGDVYGTGYYRISGDFSHLLMDISARTEAGTAIHVPLSSASTAQDTDLLTFVAADLQEAVGGKEGEKAAGGKEKEAEGGTMISVDIQADVTPAAQIYLEINKATGDVLQAAGNGQVSMKVDPIQDRFTMLGDYEVESGSYLFVLQGLISKRFSINPGGHITFTGDIMQTNLDLTAAYQTKASLNTLLADTTYVGNRRPVSCQINISGALMNPGLGFGIEVEDLDATTRARVDAALNTEDKVMKQFVALLLTGSFLPNQESGIVNNSGIFYSNASELLSNQLNNIFTQLNIPLDVGFSYQPGAAQGKDMFDVAISTQLFNNRVVVNGNVGSSQYSGSTDELAGDVDIEVKIDDKGKFRVTLFSHAADRYSNYLDQTQRSGGGFVYQEEFNSFGELWRRLFRSKKKFQAALQQQLLQQSPPDGQGPARGEGISE